MFTISRDGHVQEAFGLGSYDSALKFLAACYDVPVVELALYDLDPAHVVVCVNVSNNPYMPAPATYTVDDCSAPVDTSKE